MPLDNSEIKYPAHNSTSQREVHEGDRTALAFGALLHDVGKVIYRGSSERATHSKLGADFLANEVAAQNEDYEGPLGKQVVEQVRYHHAREMVIANLPSDSLAYITYFADNISAGFDRKNEGDDAELARFDRNVKLRKIFNILNSHRDDNTIEHDDYNVIREDLLKNLAQTPIAAESVNSLLNLLEATTDKVPSSTNTSELVDVSLYDHAKTTAGVALCIYDYLYEHGERDYQKALFDQKTSRAYYDKKMFLLCSCDMSGIQDFIYNISGDGALKQLRARSLYLELMMEHVVDELLDRLQLSRTNLMYTGGGHAYLLLPNTEFVHEQIEQFQQELSQWFVDNYRTDLYLAMATVPCSANDLANKGDGKAYGNLYRSLSRQMSQVKAARYSADVLKDLNFGNDGVSDHSRECTECHRSDLNINDEGKCELCAKLGQISKQLVQRSVFVISEDDRGLPLPFGAYLSMWARDDYLRKEPASRRVYTKNDWDMGLNLATHIWMGDYSAKAQQEGGMADLASYAKRGTTIPQGAQGNSEAEREAGDPEPSEDQDGSQRLGIKRLGVLRADVDNLGATFVSGLPASKASISRSATLSRALSYFFKYRLNEVLEAGNYQAQIIYSGGDDLFLVGNWDDVIHAAIDIRNALNEFTGNGTLTVSAGIGMFDEKYPIARMAAETGELEDAAKTYRAPGSTVVAKNAVALWTEDAVFGWDEFVDKVQPRLQRMHEVFDGNEKGKAFIYKLLYLLRDLDKPISAPRLAYLLARSFEDDPNGDAIGQEFYSWAADERERKCLVTALEWYVYETRERN